MSLLDYWETQRGKRRKVSGESYNESSIVDQEAPLSPSPSVEVADTPAPAYEDAETQIPPSSQTDLETSLPPIKTDDQAIEEYEASHAAEQEGDSEPGLHVRLRDGVWQKGRSSIYVDAFNLALDTVLAEESHLFDEAEMEVFRQWRELSYQSHSYSDISDVSAVAADLQRDQCLPKSEDETSDLSSTFRFADGTKEITTLEEASSLLLLEELKVFAKEAKVQGKSKKELVAALLQSSQTQTGLGWKGNETPSNRDSHFVQKILDYTGDCIRLAAGPRALFERVHLVFYRSTEWTEKSLTTIILAKISRRNFPEYIVCRSNSIFPSRATLLEFESAIRTQYAVDNILEFNGPPTTESLQEIIDLADKFYPRWTELVEQEQQKEDSIYESGEGAYLRRFSPAWVYTRIIHKSLHPLGRFKEHKREHEVLCKLLAQRLFHAARRGAWYQRKALLEEHYMWALMPSDGQNEEQQRKFWKRNALRTCEEGLEDPLCHLIYHYDLQKRITKLEKALKVVKREQHDFGYVMLTKPAERTIEGIRIEREDSPTRTPDPLSKRGRPTIWIDERDEGAECRVESMCLSWYRDHGWKGYHSEGGIVRTLVCTLLSPMLTIRY
ncbi:hypothetical protein N7510_003489 [Penicillium lagena]|uniref:uncharacterized protein n=1 Tax=Penicillium lagena TaxID=94218 RepID=UPI0025405D60|nr:uncharacterized protein N7510_003489 [Penicillium lagena]KAJ5619505.1 hypothetical protein N7510_003489 [Penicillium lagena]